MAKKLESYMVPLTKLFSQDFFFRIPEYQRPFLWDAEHFKDLLDDLTSSKPDEPYFLGTLVLHEYQPSQYDVVDGQQRLTALCILLACLRDAPGIKHEVQLRNELHEKIIQPERILDNVPAKHRLQVKDQSAFNALIATIGGAANPVPDPSKDIPSSRRYELARSIFWAKISKMTADEVRQLAGFVTQQCHLIYLATDSFEDAFRLFTVVNDRGKQLRRIDVLKAHNLDPSYVPGESARSKYAHQWESMEDQLGETQFEEIFHLLRLIYVKDKPQTDLQGEFANRILGKDKMPQAGAEFMDELGAYVNLYDALFVARDYLDHEVQDARYHTLMEAMVNYFTASEWKACLLFHAKRFGRNGLYEFLLKLEKVYLDHWVRGVRKDERYSTYTGILKSVQSANSPAELLENIGVDLDSIVEACRSSNFYNAGHAKYLLVRAEIAASELDHPRHFLVRSIEHVLPQNPAADSLWVKNFTDAQRKELVDSAGNLVLLSKSKNSAAGRRDFAEKKKTYLKPRVSDFPRSMEVLDYDAWTPEVIKARTENFASSVLVDP
ncbi:DUF262 domain-containing HNH endonuclease family protein [Microbispora hainanensis]|uniref:DUF262 domain-containing HNH endonuclease family protein n=1 Tax=Microbispora hainanensis TaxID=568844 RepID=A0ABZ1SH82_9ACTN|nr:DUF262 domain-containing HNH endonuclease family protein [Microbispora hainanensis]